MLVPREGWKPWWDKDVWDEAIAIAAAVAPGGTLAGLQSTVLETGPHFWLMLMASFPAFRDVNLVRSRGVFKKRKGLRMVTMSPGKGVDMVLQTFDWASSVGSLFTRPSLAMQGAILYAATYCCDGKECTRCVAKVACCVLSKH